MSSSAKKRHIEYLPNTPSLAQKIPCVALRHPRRKARKQAAAAVLGLFAFILGATTIGGMRPGPTLPLVDKTVNSYEISLGSAQTSNLSDDLMDVDKPRIAAKSAGAKAKSPMPPREVEETHFIAPAEAAPVEETPEAPSTQDEAAFQSNVAKTLTRSGDIEQALRFQHRAAELDPHNMYYRLGLAVLYDRIGAAKSAAALYQEVLQAYARHDASLPPALDVADIRARADYLVKDLR